MPDRIRRLLGPLLAILLFSVAGFILFRELKAYHFHDLKHALGLVPAAGILASAVATILGYFNLTVFDSLALRYAGAKLSYQQSALTTFLAYSFQNSIGLSILGSGAVRYRLYSHWGLTVSDIVRVIIFTSLTLWMGIIACAGSALVIEPPHWTEVFPVYYRHGRFLGAALLAITIAYLLATFFIRKPLRFRKIEIAIPGPEIAIPQILLACVNWIVAGLALYFLLPEPRPIFTAFLTVFLVAQMVALISHVPGGLGVFEAVMLLFLKTHMQPQTALASLIAFRAVYYLSPFILGMAVFAVYEITLRLKIFKGLDKRISEALQIASPTVLTLLLFGAGLLLMLAGTLPAAPFRLKTINSLFPLIVIELAHFLGSLTGVFLIITAARLQRRYQSAWIIAVVLLGLGIVFSLLKGLDYENAVILLVILLLFLPFRKNFDRKLSLLKQPITPGWITALVLSAASMIWLGVFAYKHLLTRPELFFKFSLSLNAPRFFRASVGISFVILVTSLMTLLRSGLPHAEKGRKESMEVILPILEKSGSLFANLALTGDKQLFFNSGRNAFLMYGWRGSTCVTMGDPVGPDDEAWNLVWMFREEGAREGADIAFYQVRQGTVDIYSSLGFSVLRLGESAWVDLDRFSVDLPGFTPLKQSQQRSLDMGLEFEICGRDRFPSLLPELREVSDGWLGQDKRTEKSFSSGCFDPDYLSSFDIATVRQGGKIIAFSNLLRSGTKAEAGPDLVRLLPEAPEGTRAFMILGMLLAAKGTACRKFHLGIAPFPASDIGQHTPYWLGLSKLMYDGFETAEDLRTFMGLFHPEWETSYLAVSGQSSLPKILMDISAVISGPAVKPIKN